jgi:phosphoglycolate phosphatase
MFFACKLTGSVPEECIYIGDAKRDIEAGHNAGMRTVIAEYGYIGDWEDTSEWQADHSIRCPSEILALLED